MPSPARAVGTVIASSPQHGRPISVPNAAIARTPTTPTRAATPYHSHHGTRTPPSTGRQLRRHPSLPIAVAVDAGIPDRPNYAATDEWVRTHLSHFDTHRLTKDYFEIGMATILNHLGAHPMSMIWLWRVTAT